MLKWVGVPESVETSWIYKRTKVFDILCKEILHFDWNVEVRVQEGLTIPFGPDKGARAVGFYLHRQRCVYLDTTSSMSTFLHEISHALSAHEKTTSHRTYTADVSWSDRPEEQKAMLETKILKGLLKICGSKTPKAKQKKELAKLKKTWKNYRKSHFKIFA